MNRKTIAEWELEKGVQLRTKKIGEKYTEKEFQKLICTKPIKVKTEKGLHYLEKIKDNKLHLKSVKN